MNRYHWNAVLGAACCLFALVLLLVWIPADVASGVIEQVSATTWPEGLQAHFDEVQTTATDLLAALEAGDAAAAGPLATDLYDMLHEIAMGVME